jgi:hypothetical protein
MSKEIPILLSTPMVLALLDGRKTKTRRVIKPQPLLHNDVIKMPIPVDQYCKEIKAWSKKGYTQVYTDGPLTGMIGPKCKYEVGDILWVRESFNKIEACPGISIPESYMFLAHHVKYKRPSALAWKWKPSIHMPKVAARIWLEVTEVRVERLQDITNLDAISEGIDRTKELVDWHYKDYMDKEGIYAKVFPIDSFKTLWQKINGEESWDANPWVLAISFKVLSTTGKP